MSISSFVRRIKNAFAPPEPTDWQRLAPTGQVSAGVGTYHLHGLRIHDFPTQDGSIEGRRLIIGKYCSLAAVEFMLGGNHRTSWISQYPFATFFGEDGEPDGLTNGDIVVGNDVWIGEGALVMSGVTIGDGAVVAARAVVTKDVRPYAVVGGVPARQLAKRFDDDTITRLLEMRWWDWPESDIRRRWRELSRPPA